MALVSKILESTLTAGSTTVTFTDSDIPNSLIRVFSSNSDVIPESRILSGNTLTVTYAPQSNNMDVALEMVKQGLDIVDNVLSEDTDKALSAKQGYLLSAAIGDVSDDLSTLTETVNNLDIPDNITDLDDVNVSDIQTGQVLAWNGTKFVNVDQSGGGGSFPDFSKTEVNTGIKWIDGKYIYMKTYEFASPVSFVGNDFRTITTDATLNIDTILFGTSNPDKSNTFTPVSVRRSGNNIQCFYTANWSCKWLTIWYTKAS